MTRPPERPHEAVLRRQDDGSTWQPDAVLAVSRSSSWQITDHPVEQGVVVADHVQAQPDTLVLTVVLTENPTQIGGRLGGPVRLRQLLDWLYETANEGRLVDVVTRRLGTWTGYAVQLLPLTLDNVARLRFDLTLRRVRVATSTTVQITVDTVADSSAAGAPDEVDLGEQPTTSTDVDPQAEAADQSILAGLLSSL